MIYTEIWRYDETIKIRNYERTLIKGGEYATGKYISCYSAQSWLNNKNKNLNYCIRTVFSIELKNSKYENYFCSQCAAKNDRTKQLSSRVINCVRNSDEVTASLFVTLYTGEL